MASPMLPLVFATLLVTAAVLLIALSFATDHWQETIVQRKQLKALAKDNPSLAAQLTTPLYFTRERGMFRTCYPGNETLFLDSVPNKVDDCIPQSGYELPSRNEETIGWGSDYDTRIHLMRSHFAFFVLSLLLLVVASIMGAIGCWQMKPKVLKATGLISFFGAFFALGGMAFFHGYEYIENSTLDLPSAGQPAYWTSAAEHRTLQNYASMQYGFSYMLGWIGVGMAAISAILFVCAAMSSDDEDNDDRSPLAMKERNRAYEYSQSQMGSTMGGQPQALMMSAAPGSQQAVTAPQVMAPQIMYAPAAAPDYGYGQMQQYPAVANMAYDYNTGTYARY